MGRNSKHTPKTEKTKTTVARVLKKDCRTCDNEGYVRVAPPRGPQGKNARQQYYPPTQMKCPDC